MLTAPACKYRAPNAMSFTPPYTLVPSLSFDSPYPPHATTISSRVPAPNQASPQPIPPPHPTHTPLPHHLAPSCTPPPSPTRPDPPPPRPPPHTLHSTHSPGALTHHPVCLCLFLLRPPPSSPQTACCPPPSSPTSCPRWCCLRAATHSCRPLLAAMWPQWWPSTSGTCLGGTSHSSHEQTPHSLL